jgi:hypothetical protein
LKPVFIQQAKSPLSAQACMAVFHQLVAERRNGMTEDGAMEQTGSTECVAPYLFACTSVFW